MDGLNYKLNVIDKLMRQCEQSKLESFSYQDTMFSIRFSKVESKADDGSSTDQKDNMENVFRFKKDNMEIDLNEYTISDFSQIHSQEKEDMITMVSPYVGMIEFSNQIKLGDEIHVNKGDVICSVEAMKIYNDIKAPSSGTIVELLAKDSSMVEYEQPIVKIRVDKIDEQI